MPGIQIKGHSSEGPPIELQGLGSSKKMAKKWTVLLPLSEGGYIGSPSFAVDHILGPLQRMDISMGLQRIKEDNDALDKDEVQRASIYSWIGGKIDVLIGVRLLCIFPEAVHTLNCGLTLFKLKLKCQDSNIKYCIGGPFGMGDYLKDMYPESVHFLHAMEEGLKEWSYGNTAKIAKLPAPNSFVEGSDWDEIDLAAVDMYLDKEEKEHHEHIDSCFLCQYSLELPTSVNSPAQKCKISHKNEISEPSLLSEYIDMLVPGTLHLCEIEGLERLHESLGLELSLSDPDLLNKLKNMITCNVNKEKCNQVEANNIEPAEECNNAKDNAPEEPIDGALLIWPEISNILCNEEEYSMVISNHLEEEKKDQNDTTRPNDNQASNKNYKKLIEDHTFILDPPDPSYRCMSCKDCHDCKFPNDSANMTSKQHMEEYLLRKSVRYDSEKGCFIAALPLLKDPEKFLASNEAEAKRRYQRTVQKLDKEPENKKLLMKQFEKLVKLGYIEKLEDMSEETQSLINGKKKNYIAWQVVTKSTSVSTPCRQVFDASAKTKTGLSINNILCKGKPMLDLDPPLLSFIHQKHALAVDFQKFYNSCKLDPNHYHLQCIMWSDDLSPNKDPSTYIIKTLTYGLVSSSRQLELCAEIMAESNKSEVDFYNLIKKYRYVDDCLFSMKSKECIDNLIIKADNILSKYGMKAKAWTRNSANPDPAVSIDGQLTVGGYIWTPMPDFIMIRIQSLYFHKTGALREDIHTASEIELNSIIPLDITLRDVTSNAAKVFDKLGIAGPWKISLKHLVRNTLRSVNGNYDEILREDIRKEWVLMFSKMLQLGQVGWPRNTLPDNTECLDVALVCFVDAGKAAKQQVVYICHQVKDNKGEIYWHTQLLYSKNQLAKESKTVPNEELDSLCTGSEILNKCKNALPFISKLYLIGDSNIALWWCMKDTIVLGPYQRRRVDNIQRLIGVENLYHSRREFNTADIGTRGDADISDICPGSLFNKGPTFMKLGMDRAIAMNYIKPAAMIRLNDSNQQIAYDGLVGKASMPQDYLTLTAHEEITLDPELKNLNLHFIHEVSKRKQFSNYLGSPLDRRWTITIRSTAIVFYFLHSILKRMINKCVSKNKRDSLVHLNQRMFNRSWITKDCNINQTLMLLMGAIENPTMIDEKAVNLFNVHNPSNDGEKPSKLFLNWTTVKDLRFNQLDNKDNNNDLIFPPEFVPGKLWGHEITYNKNESHQAEPAHKDFIPWSHNERPNSFVAIIIDDKSIINQVQEMQRSLQEKNTFLKDFSIHKDQLHITLLVLNIHKSMEQTFIKEFEEVMRNMKQSCFMTMLSDLAAFPNGETAYITPSDEMSVMKNINTSLREKLGKSFSVDLNNNLHCTTFKTRKDNMNLTENMLIDWKKTFSGEFSM